MENNLPACVLLNFWLQNSNCKIRQRIPFPFNALSSGFQSLQGETDKREDVCPILFRFLPQCDVRNTASFNKRHQTSYSTYKTSLMCLKWTVLGWNNSQDCSKSPSATGEVASENGVSDSNNGTYLKWRNLENQSAE